MNACIDEKTSKERKAYENFLLMKNDAMNLSFLNV